MWILLYLIPSGFAGMVKAKLMLICSGSSEIKDLRGGGVQTAAADQEEDEVCLDMAVGVHVGLDLGSHPPLQPQHHLWQQAPSQALKTKGQQRKDMLFVDEVGKPGFGLFIAF